MPRADSPCSVFAFDAYGTLFDVHAAVARHSREIGANAAALSDLWRTKQLEYTWIRTMAGAYRDFAGVTADALDFAAARFGGVSPALRAKLLTAYERLDAFPDVKPALCALKSRGAKTAILSNGTPAMLAAAVDAAGIGALLDAVISVDSLGFYKTRPEVYALVGESFAVPARQVSFQSSNRWDVAAGSKFGFRAVWINRAGAPDEYPDMPPAHALGDLAGLADLP